MLASPPTPRPPPFRCPEKLTMNTDRSAFIPLGVDSHTTRCCRSSSAKGAGPAPRRADCEACGLSGQLGTCIGAFAEVCRGLIAPQGCSSCDAQQPTQLPHVLPPQSARLQGAACSCPHGPGELLSLCLWHFKVFLKRSGSHWQAQGGLKCCCF